MAIKITATPRKYTLFLISINQKAYKTQNEAIWIILYSQNIQKGHFLN